MGPDDEEWGRNPVAAGAHRKALVELAMRSNELGRRGLEMTLRWPSECCAGNFSSPANSHSVHET